jgi:hypothetical protein
MVGGQSLNDDNSNDNEAGKERRTLRAKSQLVSTRLLEDWSREEKKKLQLTHIRVLTEHRSRLQELEKKIPTHRLDLGARGVVCTSRARPSSPMNELIYIIDVNS